MLKHMYQQGQHAALEKLGFLGGAFPKNQSLWSNMKQMYGVGQGGGNMPGSWMGTGGWGMKKPGLGGMPQPNTQQNLLLGSKDPMRYGLLA